jgi:hypothetical protein
MNTKEKRRWSVEDLAKIATGHIPLPKDIRNYNFLEFPHWALFSSAHVKQRISEEDVKDNLPYIAMLTYERVLEVHIDELVDIGFIINYDDLIE